MFIRPKKIILTSNFSIDECFKNEQDIAAIGWSLRSRIIY